MAVLKPYFNHLYTINLLKSIDYRCPTPQSYTGISDHHQGWGYEDGPWKGPEPPLLVAADFKKNFIFQLILS